MKWLAVFLVAGVTFFVSFIALQTTEAGGGNHYACNDDKKVTGTYDGPALEVTVRDSCFGPAIARIAPGTELRWVNRGQMPHNIVDVSQKTPMRDLQPGGTVTMTFAQAGAYVYFCAIHPAMTGAVFVGDSLGDTNPEMTSSSGTSSPSQSSITSQPRVAAVQLPPRAGSGVSAVAVLLLALAVGTASGGGATLLTRRLDRR